MRELTIEEMEFISGGKFDMAYYDEGGSDIVVTGSGGGGGGGGGGVFYPPTGGGSGGGTGGGGGYGDVVSAGGFAGAHVHVQATHLTQAQAAAVSEWEKDLNTEAANVANLPDNAQLSVTVTNGDGSKSSYTMLGSEVKSIFSSMQYNIVDSGSSTGNFTDRGSAQYVNGVPTATFTGSLMENYYKNQGTAGLDYLALHELAHLTTAGQDVNSHNQLNSSNASTGNPISENFANTVVNAIDKAVGLPAMSSYTNGADQGASFVTPSAP